MHIAAHYCYYEELSITMFLSGLNPWRKSHIGGSILSEAHLLTLDIISSIALHVAFRTPQSSSLAYSTYASSNSTTSYLLALVKRVEVQMVVVAAVLMAKDMVEDAAVNLFLHVSMSRGMVTLLLEKKLANPTRLPIQVLLMLHLVHVLALCPFHEWDLIG